MARHIWIPVTKQPCLFDMTMQALFKLDQALCKHCANTNQACYLLCACSVQTMFKQCSSKLTPLLDFAWTLFAHCVYTLLEHFFRCLILLDHAGLRKYVTPPSVQASLILLDFCLILIQAVIKQWTNCKKIKQVCLILLDHAWFCLIIAWFCLIIGLFVVDDNCFLKYMVL